jgi:hypothetical protein
MNFTSIQEANEDKRGGYDPISHAYSDDHRAGFEG